MIHFERVAQISDVEHALLEEVSGPLSSILEQEAYSASTSGERSGTPAWRVGTCLTSTASQGFGRAAV